MSDLKDFKLKLPVFIRFKDFDSMGHVNNAVFLTYFEQARLTYFSRVIAGTKIDWWYEGIILARVELDFRKPIEKYNDHFVYIRCSRLGNKSFDFEYVLTDESNGVEVVAESKSVMVCFDYEKKETVNSC